VTILTDLRAALEVKHEAEAALDLLHKPGTSGFDEVSWKRAYYRLKHLEDELHALLTDDTIRALLDVAEAAEHEPRCPFCAEERHMAGWPTQPHLSDCPLAPLVKEVDHDRA